MKMSWEDVLQSLYGTGGSSLHCVNPTLPQLQNHVVEFNSALTSCGKTLLVHRAEQIFQGMQDMQVEPALVTYNILISIYQKNLQPWKALGILKEMQIRHVNPDVISYTSAISACERGHMVNDAFRIFTQMQAERVTPNLISYSALISACEKCSCANSAGETLSHLIADRLQPDVISFNAALRAFAKVGDLARAKEILGEMRVHGVRPNVVSLNSFLSAYDTKGKVLPWNEASCMLEEMAAEVIRPNVRSFSTLINVYETCSQWNAALANLARMQALTLKPNMVTYTSASCACRRSINPSLAPMLYKDMKRDTVKMDLVAYNALIAASESNPNRRLPLGRFAFDLFHDMQESGVEPDILSFNGMLNICRSLGDSASARLLYHELLKERLQSDAITLHAVVETLEVAQEHKKTTQLLNTLCQIGCCYLASLASPLRALEEVSIFTTFASKIEGGVPHCQQVSIRPTLPSLPSQVRRLEPPTKQLSNSGAVETANKF